MGWLSLVGKLDLSSIDPLVNHPVSLVVLVPLLLFIHSTFSFSGFEFRTRALPSLLILQTPSPLQAEQGLVVFCRCYLKSHTYYHDLAPSLQSSLRCSSHHLPIPPFPRLASLILRAVLNCVSLFILAYFSNPWFLSADVYPHELKSALF